MKELITLDTADPAIIPIRQNRSNASTLAEKHM